MQVNTTTKDVIVAIEDFIRQLRSAGYADATIQSYVTGLKAFRLYLERRRICSFRQVTDELMTDYRNIVMATSLAPESKALKLRPVKRLFEYLVRSNRLLLNPCTGWVEISRRHRPIGPVLTISQIEHLLSIPDTKTTVGLRNRAIMEVLYSTGIRLGELLGLLVTDADLENRVIFVRRGKGSVQRVVPLGNSAVKFLSKYLAQARPALANRKRVSPSLFLTTRGTAITEGAIRSFLKKYKLHAGISIPVSPHVFRRTCATHFLQNGAGIRFVQQLLGHSSLRVTHQYTRILPVELKQTHEKTHPGVDDAAN
jgi:integrase/recombinase XerD